ncbi:MAG: hypothetical protein AB8C84_10930 [Oligoflexales bacterium]
MHKILLAFLLIFTNSPLMAFLLPKKSQYSEAVTPRASHVIDIDTIQARNKANTNANRILTAFVTSGVVAASGGAMILACLGKECEEDVGEYGVIVSYVGLTSMMLTACLCNIHNWISNEPINW